MTESIFVRLVQHNNWANQKMMEVCSALSDEQLNAEPQSATKGNIRDTLIHLVSSQRGYLALLTLPVEERPTIPLTFTELAESLQASGEGLLALARGERQPFAVRLQTRDRFYVEPWVVLVQVINHATEHREQINSMLSALRIASLELDGWEYGLATRALVPMEKPS